MHSPQLQVALTPLSKALLESDMKTSPSEPVVLPPEIILKIGEEASLGTRLEMAFTCRDWFFLLIPYCAREILAVRGHRYWPEAAHTDRWSKEFASEDQVATFAQDSLGATKFRLVHDLYDTHPSSEQSLWLLRTGIVAKCTAIRSMTLTFKTKEAVRLFEVCSFPCLKKLWVDFETFKFAKEVTFHFPEVEELQLEGAPPRQLFNAIVSGCPKLRTTTLWLYEFHKRFNKTLRLAPDSFVETVKTVHCEDPNSLVGLIGRQSFQPETIDDEGFEGGIVYSDNIQSIWGGLVNLNSLATLVMNGVPSSCLLLGLPPNLEYLCLSYLQLSRVDWDDVERLRDILGSSTIKSVYIGISIYSDDPADYDGNTPAELRAFGGQMTFFAGMIRGDITVDFVDFDSEEKKREFAREFADRVEHFLEEQGA